VLAASWQDRDGAKTAPLSAYMLTPIRHVHADQGVTAWLVDRARDTPYTTLEIVRNPQANAALPSTPDAGAPNASWPDSPPAAD
jgi:hypothetical protein